MANTTVNPYGPARGTSRITYSANNDTPAYVFNGGEALTVNGLPSETAGVALGNTWHCSIATGSAFTHVNAWPTTRAELVLKNNYGAASGVAFVIRSVWYANVATSIAAAASATLLAQIVASSATAVTDDTAQLITSQSGKASYGGSAQRAVANTAYAVASKWQVLGQGTQPGTATIGFGFSVNVNGALILPPQAILCLNAAVTTATGTASIGVVWDEVIIPLG